MKLGLTVFALGVATVLAGAAQANMTKADEATIRRIALKEFDKSWIRCGSSWFIAYSFDASRPTFPPPVDPQPQSSGKGYREARLTSGSLEPIIRPAKLTDADLANGYEVRAKVEIRVSLVRDYDASGRFSGGSPAQWTNWRDAAMPILSFDIEKKNRQWRGANRWLGRVNEVEGVGAKLYRPTCQELPPRVHASGRELPTGKGVSVPSKTSIQCTAHATLFTLVDGQCLNGRPCHQRDPQTGGLVNACVTQEIDKVTGTITTKSIPECDCRRGILKSPAR